ncbi:MAG: hypothetical protein K8T25_09975, partial [Planctomycetia bacterium]|nr:hypothetical protein [Planctomycetia bacterium]
FVLCMRLHSRNMHKMRRGRKWAFWKSRETFFPKKIPDTIGASQQWHPTTRVKSLKGVKGVKV